MGIGTVKSFPREMDRLLAKRPRASLIDKIGLLALTLKPSTFILGTYYVPF